MLDYERSIYPEYCDTCFLNPIHSGCDARGSLLLISRWSKTNYRYCLITTLFDHIYMAYGISMLFMCLLEHEHAKSWFQIVLRSWIPVGAEVRHAEPSRVPFVAVGQSFAGKELVVGVTPAGMVPHKPALLHTSLHIELMCNTDI